MLCSYSNNYRERSSDNNKKSQGRAPKGETIESFKGPRTGIYSFNLDFVRKSEIVEYGSSYTGISLQFGD